MSIALWLFTSAGLAANPEPLYPSHPPIETIPPAPMPVVNAGDEPPPLTVPTNRIVYGDLRTGEVTVFDGPNDWPAVFAEIAAGTAMAQEEWGEPTLEMLADLRPATTNERTTFPGSAMVKLVLEKRCTDPTHNFPVYGVCSGTMLDYQIVLTAGHCISYRNPVTPDRCPLGHEIGRLFTAAWVYPAWDGVGTQFSPPGNQDLIAPFGWSSAVAYSMLVAWSTDQNLDFDFAVLRLGDRPVGALTNWLGYARLTEGCPTSETRYNWSYPAEPCEPAPPLGGGRHNGRVMYYTEGTVDSCPGNLYRVDSSTDCLHPVWQGMSGSPLYGFIGAQRYVEATCSHFTKIMPGGNRIDMNWARLNAPFAQQIGTFINDTHNVPANMHALKFRVNGTNRILAGRNFPGASWVMVNPTSADPAAGQLSVDIYISNDPLITAADTKVATFTANLDMIANTAFPLNVGQIPVPAATGAGQKWMGLIFSHPADTSATGNATNTWDAQPIIVSRCIADMSGTVDPNSPDYGIPDGLIDSSDFFFYLDRYAALDFAIADLTGSADPNDPAYGVPNGRIDASDFFYFLDQFVRGCP